MELKCISNKRDFLYKVIMHLRFLFSERTYLKLTFKNRLGYKLDLDNPTTFSEKLQWLKLYDRKPEYTSMVDKFEVKKIVSELIGNEYVIPTLGVWDSPAVIEWESLPQRFVLKTTHGGGGGGVFIVNDKQKVDKKEIEKKLSKALKHDVYKYFVEWPYKNVKKRIIAEQYIEDFNENGNDLMDYKFFCFNGKPEYCQVISGRKDKMSIDFYDMEWNHQPFHEPYFFPFSDSILRKPEKFEKMIELAKKLSNGFSFLRVDFYHVNCRIYFGELTFYPTSGMGGFSPREWDIKFGNMIKLQKQ